MHCHSKTCKNISQGVQPAARVSCDGDPRWLCVVNDTDVVRRKNST